MKHLKKSLSFVAVLAMLLAGNVVKAEQDEHSGYSLVGGEIITKKIVGAWVVNATTLVQTGTVETEVHSFGNFNFFVDGNYVSFLTPEESVDVLAIEALVANQTAGSGVWHDAGHHKYKGIDVRSGLTNARVKNEVRIQLSKDANKFVGVMNSTFFPVDGLEFVNALPWSPITWKLEGVRVPSK